MIKNVTLEILAIVARYGDVICIYCFQSFFIITKFKTGKIRSSEVCWKSDISFHLL